MSYSISSTDRFEKEVKKLLKKFPSLKEEYATLITILKDNPFYGTAVGNNCYKIRLAIASKGVGKSGGARVITHIHIADNKIYLLTIYDKSEQKNITDQDILKLIGNIQ